ncbi:unnamed protein product [Cladocopium goreaui]|uniref:Methyltransferase domain-containing protein n=1 Tax=Cladocopium goreaui TaxID=2562237 RepID=A0A9P1GG11_9DINO|nr:unnamed protein product [Cladocopium goreaui]
MLGRHGFAMVLFSSLRRAATQPLQRHQLPVSAWRKNSRSCIQLGDVRSFKESGHTGDADELLCAVGGIIGSELPDRVARKELFEAHAVARVVDRHFPEETEITEFCAGCGLLGIFLMLLNPRRRVRCSDKKKQLLACRLQDALTVHWPFLQGITWEEEDARHGQLKTRGELVASCHACSVLSDEVILTARRGRSPLVLVPCCYQKAPRLPREVGWPWLPNWSWKRWPWLEEGSINAQGRDAIHAARVKCLEEDGYEVWEEFIDPNISKMNMAIVAQPT